MARLVARRATVALGWKLNFLNIVVLPAMIGVDDGVHYYRRWDESGRDSARTYREMFEPLTVTTLTTIMGYGGLTAHHPELRSTGSLGVLGLVCRWLTALKLLPGLLSWRYRRTDPMSPVSTSPLRRAEATDDRQR